MREMPQPTSDATADALRNEIRSLGPWHYDIEIAPGVRTGAPVPPGTYSADLGTPAIFDPFRMIDQLTDYVYGGDLEGRTLLDCACNAGGYLFGAARRGAGPSFGFDVREHWINQARFLKRHLGGDIDFEVRDVLTLPERALPQFDITLFMGIFYHLPDPVTALRMAADQTKELLVLNTAIAPQRRDALVLSKESVTEVMSGVHRLAWLPTSERILREILAWCGFPHARVVWFRRRDQWKGRIHIFAARDEKTFARYDAGYGRPRPLFERAMRRILGYA
jgi:tRNA (mo5U34)-methyltransferase